jgi:hypothetical protein
MTKKLPKLGQGPTINETSFAPAMAKPDFSNNFIIYTNSMEESIYAILLRYLEASR